jgi:hypothetical protein
MGGGKEALNPSRSKARDLFSNDPVYVLKLIRKISRIIQISPKTSPITIEIGIATKHHSSGSDSKSSANWPNSPGPLESASVFLMAQPSSE